MKSLDSMQHPVPYPTLYQVLHEEDGISTAGRANVPCLTKARDLARSRAYVVTWGPYFVGYYDTA